MLKSTVCGCLLENKCFAGNDSSKLWLLAILIAVQVEYAYTYDKDKATDLSYLSKHTDLENGALLERHVSYPLRYVSCAICVNFHKTRITRSSFGAIQKACRALTSNITLALLLLRRFGATLNKVVYHLAAVSRPLRYDHTFMADNNIY